MKEERMVSTISIYSDFFDHSSIFTIPFLSPFSTLIKFLVLAILIHFELAERHGSRLLSFCYLSSEVAFVWVGIMKEWVKLEYSSSWLGSTKLFPLKKSSWLIASLSTKILEAVSLVLLLTKLRRFLYFFELSAEDTFSSDDVWFLFRFKQASCSSMIRNLFLVFWFKGSGSPNFPQGFLRTCQLILVVIMYCVLIEFFVKNNARNSRGKKTQ